MSMLQDTAGSERYEAMSRIYYRGAKAAIVCYDITDKSSFDRVRFWVEELRKNEMVNNSIYSSQCAELACSKPLFESTKFFFNVFNLLRLVGDVLC